jgi:hypothetical protein
MENPEKFNRLVNEFNGVIMAKEGYYRAPELASAA